MATLPTFINNFPSRDNSFVGCENFISQIHEIFQTGENLLIINGIGGIGKTALIREFAHQKKNNFDHFIWISAKNGIFENIALDTNLVNNLQIEEKVKSSAHISHRIINKLSEIEGNNLLILDDLDEDFIHFQKLFPLKSNWKILASSRIEFPEFKNIRLKELTAHETLELFYKHYSLHQNDDLIIELFRPLSNHPLTIELFAKTAQFHKLPLTDLLKRATSKGFDFSQKATVSIAHSNTIVEHLGKYYELIFPVEKNADDEIKIIRQLAVLPANFTPINDLFKLLSISAKDEDNFSYHLNNLVKKGWVENFGTTYRLSQIIKAFIHYKYPLQTDYYEDIIQNLRGLLTVDTVKASPVGALKWLKYGQEILNCFRLEHVEVVTLANNLTLRYRDNGNFGAARQILEKVLEHDIQKFGEGNTITELSRANLGNVYSDLGDYQKASELLEISLKHALKNYPEGHPKIAARQSNLGLIYRDLGQLEKAEKLLKDALDADLKNYPEENENVAVRQSNLALVYKDLGEYKKARDLLEKSIATAIKHHGKLHPRVALRLSNLSLVYKAMGEYKKALDLLEKALESDLTNFGDVHPKVAVRLMNISIICLEIAELKKAKKSITKALDIAMATLGESHPDTVAIKRMYDKIYGM